MSHLDGKSLEPRSAPFLDAGLRPFRSALQKFVWRLGVTTKARSSPLGCPSGQAAWTRWWENPASSLWPLRHPAHECRCVVEPVGLVGDCERGSLKDVLDAAWAQHPESRALPGRRDAAQAQQWAAAAWTPEPPALAITHKTDRFNRTTALVSWMSEWPQRRRGVFPPPCPCSLPARATQRA
jgi:hypothetical protein